MDRRRNRGRDKHSRRDTVNRKAGVLAAVYVAVLAINLDVTIVNVALPRIATELHADTPGLQWVVDGYNLTFAALVLAAGSLADRYGRRPALLIGLLGFAVTSAIGALATSTGARLPRGSAWAYSPRDLPHHTFDHHQHLLRPPPTRHRTRRMGRSCRGRRRSRAGHRRPAARTLLVEQRLLGTHTTGPAGSGAHILPGTRITRPRVPALDIRGLTTSIALLGVLVYTIIEAPARAEPHRDAVRIRRPPQPPGR